MTKSKYGTGPSNGRPPLHRNDFPGSRSIHSDGLFIPKSLSDLHVLGILALGQEQKVAALIGWLDAQDHGI